LLTEIRSHHQAERSVYEILTKNDTLNFQPAMNTKHNLLILSAIAVPVSAVLAGRWLVARQTRRDVADLFAQRGTDPVDTFDPAQLADLPPPVQRYFWHVLRPGQPYLQTARLRHDGQFKTDLKRDWIPIMGDEYFLAGKPGYIWVGTTAWFSARDQYVAGRGSLTVRLLSALSIQRGSGPSYD
jgi:hypothetical protein